MEAVDVVPGPPWTQPAVKKGFMEKQGETATSKFKRRAFSCVKGSSVCKYYSDKLHILKGQITLDGGEVSLVSLSGVNISLHTTARIWNFIAESVEEASEWSRVFQAESGAAISKALDVRLDQPNATDFWSECVARCVLLDVDPSHMWQQEACHGATIKPLASEHIVVGVCEGSAVKCFEIALLGQVPGDWGLHLGVAVSIEEVLADGEVGRTLVKMKYYGKYRCSNPDPTQKMARRSDFVPESVAVETTATQFKVTISNQSKLPGSWVDLVLAMGGSPPSRQSTEVAVGMGIAVLNINGVAPGTGGRAEEEEESALRRERSVVIRAEEGGGDGGGGADDASSREEEEDGGGGASSPAANIHLLMDAAEDLVDAEKFAEAEPLYRRIIAALEGWARRGPDDPIELFSSAGLFLTMMNSVLSLAKVLQKQGKLEEASVQFRRVKDTYERTRDGSRVLGAEVGVAIDLANVLELQHKFKEGAALLKTMLNLLESDGESKGAAPVKLLLPLADLLESDGKLEEAHAALLLAMKLASSKGAPPEWIDMLKKEVARVVEKITEGSSEEPAAPTAVQKEAAIQKVTLDPMSLRDLPDGWKQDRDIILAATMQDGRALTFADLKLQNDKSFITWLVTENPWALEGAKEEFQNDEEVVMAGVKQDDSKMEGGNALMFASPELHANKAFIIACVTANPTAMMYVTHPSLQADPDMLAAARAAAARLGR